MKESVKASKSTKKSHSAKNILPPVMVRSVTTQDDEAPRQAAKPTPEMLQQFKTNRLMEEALVREHKRSRELKRQRKREREVLLREQEKEIDGLIVPQMQRCNAGD
jgi:hypothetical protein